MNNCMLLAEIVQAPQLRYTSDNQTPVAEFWVEFPPLKENDPAAKLKVVAWGNLGQEVQANYQAGQRVLLEGRLAMNVIDRPEGFKEKQVEMTLQRLYDAGAFSTMAMTAPAPLTPPTASPAAPAAVTPASAPSPRPPVTPPAASAPSPNYDDIPF
ncbi:MAG: single-stranded DNA-binding protein [Nodosilinea sp.]|jgi:single-stranded DNA-binding protein